MQHRAGEHVDDEQGECDDEEIEMTIVAQTHAIADPRTCKDETGSLQWRRDVYNDGRN